MGFKAKKAMKKNLKKASSQLSRKDEAPDFLPLEGGPGRKLPEQKPQSDDKATVLYLGRIPHGFYEKEMEEIGHEDKLLSPSGVNALGLPGNWF
uniref:Uncharacterized protein n=1 Tax=Fagus sylvatica TaxID=28930 RepID=A0A2N9IC09_FAGSY